MIKLPMSDDVLALNPELRSSSVTYPTKRERIQKAGDLQNGYDSLLEAEFDSYLSWSSIAHVLHPFTFILPGGVKYTPDFISWMPDDRPIIYECKGDKRQKNARDSYTRFRIAAGLNLWARFIWVEKHDGEWVYQEFTP